MSLPSGEVVTRWLLDADQHMSELNKVNKAYRQQEADERKLEYIRGKLNLTTAESESVFSKLSGTILGSVTGANLLTQAIGFGVGKFKEAIAASDDYSKATQTFTGDIEKLRVASKGMMDDIEIMTGKNKLMAAGVKISDESYGALLSSLEDVTDAMGKDYSQAVSQVTDGIIRQSDRAMKQYGIMIDAKEVFKDYAIELGKTTEALTDEEKQQALANVAIEEFKKKAESLPPVADNFTDKIKILGNSIWNPMVQALSVVNEKLGIMVERLGQVGSKSKSLSEADSELFNALGILKGGRKQGGQEDVASEMLGYISPGEGEPGFGSASSGIGVSGLFTRGIHGKAAPGTATYEGSKRKTSTGRTLRSVESGGDSQHALRKTMGLGSEQDDLFQMDSGLLDSLEQQTQAFELAAQAAAEATEINAQWAKGQLEMMEATKKANVEIERQEYINSAYNETVDMVTNATIGLAGSMWAAADAAIMEGRSFGEAASIMVKQTLLALAQEATVKALFELAQAAASWWNGYAVSQHLYAAGMYGVVAAVAGGGGLAMSAAGVGAQGGGSKGSGEEAQRKYNRESRESPVIGKKQKVENTFNVQLYIGDPMDGSAALLMSKQLNAQISRAA